MTTKGWVSLLLAAGVAVGCGESNGGADPDAGDSGADGGPGDSGGDGPITLDTGGGDTGGGDTGGGDTGGGTVDLPSCTAPLAATGTLDATATVAIDNTDGVAGPLDLGESCGNPSATSPSPQTVVAYTVPGTGDVLVEFTLVNAGTSADFDTVVQARTDCAAAPSADFPPTCFDDAGEGELRSAGAVTATGGDTLYLVVTGFAGTAEITGGTDRGAASLEITASSNAAPVLTSGSLTVDPENSVFELTGTDADENAAGLRFLALDASDDPIDLTGEGTIDGADHIWAMFDTSVAGSSPFAGSVSFAAGDDFRTLDVAKVRVWAFDAGYLTSSPLDITVDYTGYYGEPCAPGDVCAAGLTCAAGTCGASADVVTACTGATVLAITTPTTTTTTVDGSGTLTDGAGHSEGVCANITPATDTGGKEALFSVAVPAGDFDLIARTDVTGTADDDDTVIYVRTTCEDPSSEPADGCGDDIDYAGGEKRSRVELLDAEAGTYTIFVEPYHGAPLGTGETLPFTVRVELRPVLATGAACDPSGANSRCAAGDCPAGGTPTCP